MSVADVKDLQKTIKNTQAQLFELVHDENEYLKNTTRDTRVISEQLDEGEYVEQEYGDELDDDEQGQQDFIVEEHIKGNLLTSKQMDYDIMLSDLGDLARDREEMIDNFLSDYKPENDPEDYNAWTEEKLSGRATRAIKSEVNGFNEDEFDNHADEEIDAEYV